MRHSAAIVLATLVLACSGGVPPEGDAGVDPCEVDPALPECRANPCDPSPCTGEHERCLADDGVARCECEPGTHPDDGACVIDTSCEPTTCNEHGTCDDASGVVSCACDEGYAGPSCGDCADGFFPDGAGGCDADLCDPNPCDSDPERDRCEVEDGVVVCRCSAGTHEEDGACVRDRTCTPDTCAGHGTCMESMGAVGCACDEGWAGAFCDACDEAGGYHADGAGGCTTDVCVPSPCTEPLRSVCTAGPEGAQCECDPGAHLEGGACVPDETCAPTSCSGHGTCSVDAGRVSCACDAGYSGAACDACDTGWHDDGMGGCTTDPCLPSPCTAPNRGVCTAGASGAVCSCDAGWHDDGVGGCTMDPCVPDPCAAMGMACRDDAGTAECYTPVCDDGNPCTTDAFSGGACVFTPRADGSACSTTVCTSSQVCTAGVCGGGTAVDCNDANPCTRDSCDAIAGCRHVNDDALVPDDGVSCTDDACSAGVASHVASDARCDDGLYCDGVKRCAPSAAGADANGCVRESVPAPPGPSSPCRYYAACDEASDSFPLVVLPMGASCDDRIACTSGDVCRSAGGACAGTPMASCPGATSCTSTVPWSSSIDVPSATVTGAITLGGAAPPATLPPGYYESVTLYAVSRDTGMRHTLGWLRYGYRSGSPGYVLDSRDGSIDARLVPGIYDLLYARGYDYSSSSGQEWVDLTDGGDPFPNGWRLLQSGVVIGAGANVLNVDIPSATVTGAITLGGAAPPMTLPPGYYESVTLYAISRDTGMRHTLGYLRYGYRSGSPGYVLDSRDGSLSARLVPGTYDLLYARGYDYSSSSGQEWVDLTDGGDPFPNGWRLLQSGVVLSSGTNVLNVDIPSATVTGAITLGGATPPMTLPPGYYESVTLYAISRDTGMRHTLGYLRYGYRSGSPGYVLDSRDGSLSARLVPGTYDLLYARGSDYSSSSGQEWVDLTDGGDPFPNGWRLLQSGVVLSSGANVLDVDIPSATVTGAITLDGAAPPSTLPPGYYESVTLYAVSRDTGMRHTLGYLRYGYRSGSPGYVLDSRDGSLSARLVPGTYDLLYGRGYDYSTSSGQEWVDLTDGGDPFPNGWRLLSSGVVVSSGANVLNVDIPRATITGAITLDGAAPPSTLPPGYYESVTFYAVSRDTGMRHTLGWLRYGYRSGSPGYVLDSRDGSLNARLVPGTYDILYGRGYDYSSSSGQEWIDLTDGGDPFPNGWRLVRSGVVVAPGSNTLALDIPSSAIAGPLTLDGATPPPTLPPGYYESVTLYAVSRDTGLRHTLGWLRYGYRSGSPGYVLDTRDGSLDARLAPGIYDLLYGRGYDYSSSSGQEWVDLTDAGDPFPNGWRYLDRCVAFP